jgi:DNA polymerase-4
VARRMRTDGYLGRIVAVKMRDSMFHTVIRQRALPELMSDEAQIFRTASALLDENWNGSALRLVGVSVSGLVKSDGSEQQSLFEMDEHRRKMTVAVDSLRDRFGDSSLIRAGILERS